MRFEAYTIIATSVLILAGTFSNAQVGDPAGHAEDIPGPGDDPTLALILKGPDDENETQLILAINQYAMGCTGEPTDDQAGIHHADYPDEKITTMDITCAADAAQASQSFSQQSNSVRCQGGRPLPGGMHNGDAVWVNVYLDKQVQDSGDGSDAVVRAMKYLQDKFGGGYHKHGTKPTAPICVNRVIYTPERANADQNFLAESELVNLASYDAGLRDHGGNDASAPFLLVIGNNKIGVTGTSDTVYGLTAPRTGSLGAGTTMVAYYDYDAYNHGGGSTLEGIRIAAHETGHVFGRDDSSRCGKDGGVDHNWRHFIGFTSNPHSTCKYLPHGHMNFKGSDARAIEANYRDFVAQW